jgi:hypothetical protein
MNKVFNKVELVLIMLACGCYLIVDYPQVTFDL